MITTSSRSAMASAPIAPSRGCSSTSTAMRASAHGASSAGMAARSSRASRTRAIAAASLFIALSGAAWREPFNRGTRAGPAYGRATSRRAAGCVSRAASMHSSASAAAEAEAASSQSCSERGTAKSRASSGIACNASTASTRLARPDKMKTAVSARRTCRRILSDVRMTHYWWTDAGRASPCRHGATPVMPR